MMAPSPQIGDQLPPLVIPPLTRETLRRYAETSGDTNPVHLDPLAARRAGLRDVIGHGMLSMAYLGRLLTAWLPQTALRDFTARFVDMTQVQEQLICRGTVIERYLDAGDLCVMVDLVITNEIGVVKVTGRASLVWCGNDS
jgi:acyl dehydratase